MKAIIENLSPQPRRHWTTIKAPKARLSHIPQFASFNVSPGRVWPAIRGHDVGEHTIVYVRADLGGSELVEGTIEPSNPLEAQPLNHRIHPWITDDLSRVIMQAGVRVGGLDSWTAFAEWRLLFSNPALQRWWTRSIGEHGIILEVWADVWTDDPVIDIYAKVVWSDRSDPNWNRVFDGVWIKCGEALAFEFSRRHGIIGGGKNHEGLYTYLLGRDVPFCDGAALPLTGHMLCFKDRPDDLSDEEANRAVTDIIAAADGRPVLGMPAPAELAGDWLARGNIARVRVDALDQAEASEWARFEAGLQQNAGWFAARPIGCTATPGQTGSQEDFGATKGTFAVALGLPRHIWRLRYGVQSDLFRGCQHYERGRPLVLDQHPRWVTLSMITHYHTGVSTDRLGKQVPISPANGWRGYDAQHRSQNNLAAYLALQDDPLMLDHCEHMITTDLADYRRRFPERGPDAARGQGRPIGTWAQLFKVTDMVGFYNLIEAQTTQSYTAMIQQGSGEAMRVLATLGPDGRVPVYVEGQLAPTVSMWEHGLALVGFYLAHHAAGSNVWRESILTHISELLARWALHETAPNQFAIATSIHWNDGYPPLAYLWDSGSGVAGWVRAGLMVAREWLPREHELHDKVDRYLRQAIVDPDPVVGWAEWWAIADRVVLG